jgi:hypothetical protein
LAWPPGNKKIIDAITHTIISLIEPYLRWLGKFSWLCRLEIKRSSMPLHTPSSLSLSLTFAGWVNFLGFAAWNLKNHRFFFTSSSVDSPLIVQTQRVN